MIKNQLKKTIVGNRRLRAGLGLGLDFFYFILSLPPLTRDVTCSRLYLDGKNIRRQCQMNILSRVPIISLQISEKKLT